MTDEKPTYYTILPANVRYDSSISANAKILYSEIALMSKEKGYCFAGNTYLARLFGVSKRSISSWLEELENHSYLKREVKRDTNNRVIERKLYIEDLPHEVFNTTHEENFRDNITSINNTSINNIGRAEESESKERIPYKEIIEHLNEKTGKSFKSSAASNQKLVKARWNEGYRLDDFKKVVDNMVTNWKDQVFSDGKPAENYLQPSTLFGNKFDKYLNQIPKSSQSNKNSNEITDYRKATYGMTQDEIREMNNNN